MADRGLRMAGMGLLLGVGLGLAIITIQTRVARGLMEFLGDQVVRSCPTCSFKYDSVSLSLLTLRAKGTNARIIEDGKEALVVRSLSASFSLRAVLSRQVHLDTLTLSDVTSAGIGPDSATYKFVDFLSTPPPPERSGPDHWHLVLKRLTLNDGRFQEPFPFTELIGNGVELALDRTPDNNFTLDLLAEDLGLRGERLIKLGKLKAHLLLQDDYVDIEKLHMALRESTFDMASIVWTKDHSNTLEGGASFSLDEQALQLPRSLDVALSGQAQVSGVFDEPRLDGTFKADRPFVLPVPELSISEYSGSFSAELDKVVVKDIEGHGEGTTFKSTRPISITRSALAGRFEATIDSLTSGPFTANGITLTGTIGGSPDKPKLQLSGDVKELISSGINVTDVTLSALLSETDSTLDLSNKQGTLSAKLSQDSKGVETITGTLNTQELALGQTKSIKVTTALDFDGPLNDSSRLSVQGPISITSGQLTLAGNLMAEKSVLLQLKDGSGDLIITAAIEDRTDPVVEILGELKSLSPLITSARCADAAAKFSYRFSPPNFNQGSGAITAQRLSLGCNDGPLRNITVSLPQPLTFPISAGRLNLSGLNLSGNGGSLNINGIFSASEELALNAAADLNLQSLLGILPQADELRGQLTADLSVRGSLDKPILSGTGNLQDAELGIEELGIHMRDGNGKVAFDGPRIVVDGLSARVNDGNLTLAGILDTSRPLASETRMQFHGVEVTPGEGTSFVASGDVRLSLQPETGAPLLSGVVTVLSGTISRSFDVTTIIRTVVREVLYKQPLPNSPNKSSNLELALDIVSPGDIVVTTNVAELEFKGDLTVRGTLDDPIISGQIETIQGWIGLQNRQFSLITGVVRFDPESPEPLLDVLGEALLTNRAGEPVLVFLSVTGPISSRRFEFSSDRGLSEREILDLLSIGSRAAYSSESAFRSGAQGIPIIDSYSLFSFTPLLSSLTRIDSVGVEPSYNPQSGLLEPSIIARKQLFDDVSLIGESFGGQTSRIRTIVNLTDRLAVHLSAESDPARQATTLGADIAISVLGRPPSQLSLIVEGDSTLSNREVRQALRLTPQSRIGEQDLPRLKTNLLSSLQRDGFYQASAELACTAKSELYCQRIVVSLETGEQSYIDSLSYRGDSIEGVVSSRVLRRIAEKTKDAPASRQLGQDIRRELLGALRSEGYLSARVEADYTATSNPDRRELAITVHKGNAVSFIFEGNSKFTAEEFLSALNLFERRQPFGSNTVSLLLKHIERMYREAGYLYASAHSKIDNTSGDRVTHTITITEGSTVPVSSVEIIGNHSLTQQEITAYVSLQTLQPILTPKYAVAEQIEANRQAMERLYIISGFSGASVHTQIRPQEKGGVTISYQISEGTRTVIEIGELEGWPPTIEAPQPPNSPSSIPATDTYVRALSSTLRASGYHRAQLSTELTPQGTISIVVSAGEPTTISSISVRGNQSIPTSYILDKFDVQAGSRWDETVISEAKRRLLASGLFERIEINSVADDHTNLTEDLTITVAEQALRTLDVGAGLNSEYGLHIFGQYQDKALFLDGRTVTLRLDTYYDDTAARIDQGTASLRYSVPVIAESGWSFAEDLRFQRQQQDSYEFDLDRISLTSSIYRNYDLGFNVSFDHSLLFDKLNDVTPDAILGPDDSGDVALSILSGSITFDGRDDALIPRRGPLINLSYRAASDLIGSDATFGGIESDNSYIIPLADRWKLLSAARISALDTFGDTSVVPITQRLYLGGYSSLRGFRENSLGPQGADGAVLGGTRLWTASTELQYTLTDPIQVISFLDWGSLGLDTFSDEVRSSTGIGLRYLSPIGPIGFDIAHPLDEKSGEPSVRFHFAIGASR